MNYLGYVIGIILTVAFLSAAYIPGGFTFRVNDKSYSLKIGDNK